MKIIDCTLREGNQSPHVTWGNKESYYISKGLIDCGVDCIEVGHPYASELDRSNVKIVTSANPGCSVLAHARAVESDVAAVQECGADWVGIFMATNDIARSFKFKNKSVDDILDQIEASIRFAKLLKLNVRFTLEDTSRTELDLQVKAYERALRAGADRICFSDTVGILDPVQAASALAKLRNFFPTSSIEVHFHNDRGLALANALAVEKYSDWVSTSVNGIGERCGITDTLAYKANLTFTASGNVPNQEISKARHLSEIVHAFGRNSMRDRAPIVGEYAFTHCSKLHRSAFEKSNRAYCWLPDFEGQSGHENKMPDLSEFVKSGIQLTTDAALVDGHANSGTAGQSCTVTHVGAGKDEQHASASPKTLNCDSLFLLFGDEDGKEGLTATVVLNDQRFDIQSPASVFVPAGVEHHLDGLHGTGLLITQVLSSARASSLMNLEVPQANFGAQMAPELLERV
mmetsp:Transcript_24066/g.44404  ORF Transcript_24066/g.44404 Transcript_24066/m.44404 type:complete len:460 (+) Transcript_24066:517-1896(+)